MKLLLMLNASLLLCAAVQAKFPADGLIKTAASGAIQGKTVLMKAENAELSKSKLAKIRSVKFIAGMAEKDSGASWEINVAQDGEYILETWLRENKPLRSRKKGGTAFTSAISGSFPPPSSR